MVFEYIIHWIVPCLKQDSIGKEVENPQKGDMKGNELKIEVPVWRVVVSEG